MQKNMIEAMSGMIFNIEVSFLIFIYGMFWLELLQVFSWPRCHSPNHFRDDIVRLYI